MAWKPVHPNHAIERARIIVNFNGNLPIKFLKKLAFDAGAELEASGFGPVNWREGHQINISGQAIHPNHSKPQIFGCDWKKVSTSQIVLEVLVLEDNRLIFETTDYTRWSDFLTRFERAPRCILDEALNIVDISNLILEYIDRFIYDGDVKEGNARDVLKANPYRLPEAVLDDPQLWHSHVGWFEKLDNHQLLINQNIDLQVGSFNNEVSARSLQIFTKTDLRPNDPAVEYGMLKAPIVKMHNRSKHLVYDLLTPEMSELIGMEEPKNV